MARTRLDAATFRSWVQECRELFPTDAPVTVRRIPLERDDSAGVVTHFADVACTQPVEHAITIDRRMCRQAIADSLIHEWAHILHGEDTGDYVKHPRSYWEKLGELYRTWHRTE